MCDQLFVDKRTSNRSTSNRSLLQMTIAFGELDKIGNAGMKKMISIQHFHSKLKGINNLAPYIIIRTFHTWKSGRSLQFQLPLLFSKIAL